MQNEAADPAHNSWKLRFSRSGGCGPPVGGTPPSAGASSVDDMRPGCQKVDESTVTFR
jgi:hypothetical protein